MDVEMAYSDKLLSGFAIAQRLPYAAIESASSTVTRDVLQART